jgi:hypothetical protein
LLGHLQRAVIRQQDAASSYPDAGGFRGDPGEQDFGAGIGQRGDRMVLGQPVAIITQRLGSLDQPDRLLDGPLRRVAADHW